MVWIVRHFIRDRKTRSIDFLRLESEEADHTLTVLL